MERLMEAREIIDHGYGLARADGVASPDLEDAVWALLVEAAQTLQRLPDREIGWLLSCSRSAMPMPKPDPLDEYAQAVAAGRWRDMRVTPPRPSAAAITRLDEVSAWLRRLTEVSAPGRRYHGRSRRARVLFALALGVPPQIVARRERCDVSTVHRSRRDGLRHLTGIVRAALGSDDEAWREDVRAAQ